MIKIKVNDDLTHSIEKSGNKEQLVAQAGILLDAIKGDKELESMLLLDMFKRKVGVK